MTKNKQAGGELSEQFRLQARLDYFADITERINAAGKGDTVKLITLTFDPEVEYIAKLVDAMCKAAKNGANVLLMVDAHDFLRTVRKGLALPGPLFFNNKMPERYIKDSKTIAALERLKTAGGRYSIMNLPGKRFSHPFGGRSHIKLTLINNLIYVGGCNLDDSEHIDGMVSWTDPATAKWLAELCEDIYQEEGTRAALRGKDLKRKIDSKTTLFIDAGKQRQSIIYDQAMKLIDEAQERVFLTCQYFPNHITAKHLQAAQKRGVKVMIVYNHPTKDFWPFNFLHQAIVDIEHWRQPRNFFDHQLPKDATYLHAKFIATESAGMIGSHNYVRAGVNWGTAEIALIRRDPAFAQSLIKLVADHV